MTDIMEVMKAVLDRDCAPAISYYDRLLPSGSVSTYIRFQRISTFELINHSGRGNLHRDRIQVTCCAKTHDQLIGLVEQMEASLYLNNTDFKLCYPLEGSIEIPDAMLIYSKDFMVYYA